MALIDLESKRLDLIHEKLNSKYQLDGVFTFHRGVNQKMMDKLFKAMRVWHDFSPTAPWTIYLNSVGGELYSGSGILDEIAAHSLRGGGTHEITIKVRGLAASMASIILQAADHRVVGPNSLLMIHKGSGGVIGTSDEIADEAEFHRQSTEWMVQLFLSRTDKITKASLLRKINRKDWWINANEAISLGLADRIG